MAERDTERNGRGNKPLETLRDGALSVSIFRNQSEKGDHYALDPKRIYTDEKSGEVREATSLSSGEALRMAELLRSGYQRVNDFKREAKKASKERGAKRSRNDDDYER